MAFRKGFSWLRPFLALEILLLPPCRPLYTNQTTSSSLGSVSLGLCPCCFTSLQTLQPSAFSSKSPFILYKGAPGRLPHPSHSESLRLGSYTLVSILSLCHSAIAASSWKCAPWADAKSFSVRSTLISTALAPSSGLEGSWIETDRVKFCWVRDSPDRSA